MAEAIDSEVNSLAESKLGYTGGAGKKPWKYHNSVCGEAEKSVYNICMRLRVAEIAMRVHKSIVCKNQIVDF